ncbi:RsmB/NOP family class I SAM-dependent RNA methyltransferase [Pararhizobium mangrovi]|uniref:RsmB/NOP family class I SAM-dependent RNA methyltransferase n=1 Tax=Pararhizobium mangrovi TaxID=2590452 RepID=UPI0015E83885|nr:RsmB/NOP family class I SAM-dependent RNA methyltransferase [Pararhizobium mangrovi]
MVLSRGAPASARSSRPQTARPPQATNNASAKPGLAARQVAGRLLAAVVDRQVSLDGMLNATGGNAAYLALSNADRALVRAILATALRRRAAIETALRHLVERPLPEGARSLHFILCVGAAQILYLDVPDHSAVDLAVAQAHDDPRGRRFAKLVNAVLRRLSREKDVHLAKADPPLQGLPDWFRDRLVSIYGSKADAIAAMMAEPPTLDLTVRRDAETWAERLDAECLPTGTVRLVEQTGSVADMPGFAEGAWWVQDAAAALPVKLFGPLEGMRVGDLCAAPGGKTAQLAAAGARVTAIDRSANRLVRLRENLARLGLEAECVQADLLAYTPETLFDAVLLDAPCSSTGTARRHPDVPFTKSPAEIEKLADLQLRLLSHAAGLVRPGGYIVYSTCSLDPREGEDVVARALSDDERLSRVPVAEATLPGLAEAIQADGSVRTTPAMLERVPARVGGLDGFYAAVLRRAG